LPQPEAAAEVTLAERHRAAIMPVQPMETEIEVAWGQGPYLIDRQGRSWLDLATGIAVNALGYGHPRVLAAIEEQLQRHLHLYSGTGYQEVLVQYAEDLLAELPAGYQIFFGNSGTEAVEAAIKLARSATGRPGVVAFRGGFHGRSLGALSLTASSARYRSAYEPLLPSVYHVDYPAPGRLGMDASTSLSEVHRQMEILLETEIAPDRVAVVVVEPIQGEGGYVIPPAGFLPWLRALTKEHGILLAVDEVQSGMGRTGRMFAYQHEEVQPDLVMMGKALGGGLPLSALAASAELAGSWPAGTHGTTFGGNPLACAAGRATLGVIRDEHLMEAAAELGRSCLQELSPLAERPQVREVRGRGLMVAIEFSGSRGGGLAGGVVERAFRRGLIVHTAGLHHEVIRLMPPLNLTEEQLRLATEELSAAVLEVCRDDA
jgi:4-aminobutyrate aminotransferase